MKPQLAAAIMLVALAAAGLPIGSWLFVAAIVCFALGALATILTAERIAQAAFAWGALLLIAGIAITAIGGGLRVWLAHPAVQLALAVGLGALVLLAAVALAVKLWGVEPSKPKIPKLPVRERALLVESLGTPTATIPQRAGIGTHGPARSSPPPSTDELGLFRRRTS